MSRGLQRGVSRGRRLADPRDEPCGTQWAGGWALGRREGASGSGGGGGRRTPPPRLSAGLRTGARGWPRRASAPLTGTLLLKAGARAHPAPPFGGARGARRTGSRELTCRRGAKEPGARGRAGGRREAPGARARAGRCWAAAAVTMAESAGASSFFPLVVLLLAGSGGSGPRGIQGESWAGGRRGMQRARRGLAPAVGLGRAPSPAAQYGRAGGAEGRGGGSQPWGPARSSRRSPTRALRGSRFQLPQLPPLTAQASPRCGGPRLLPFSTSV